MRACAFSHFSRSAIACRFSSGRAASFCARDASWLSACCGLDDVLNFDGAYVEAPLSFEKVTFVMEDEGSEAGANFVGASGTRS